MYKYDMGEARFEVKEVEVGMLRKCSVSGTQGTTEGVREVEGEEAREEDEESIITVEVELG